MTDWARANERQQSGVGREGGYEGMLEDLESKYVAATR
jgi:hypothetical protein